MTTKVAKRKLKPNGIECPVEEKKPKPSNGTAGEQHAVKKPKGKPVSQVFKKRKPDKYVEPTSEEKAIHKVAENFRKELLTGAMAMSAIRHFLQEAFTNPELIGGYIKCGGTMKPLLAILAACERDKLTDIADVLNLIQLIMLKSLEFDETHVKYAVKCARSIMTKYQPVVCSLLQDQGEHAMASKAAALRILKAVLMVDGQTHFRDVLKVVDISSGQMAMGDYRETVAKQEGYIGNSVRSAFIEFNLAFLIDTPSQMVRFWLARPVLVRPLTQNLVFDSAENVIMIMTTLKKYVLDNPDMDKYIYRTAFTAEILKALVHAYEWVGPEKQIILESAKQRVYRALETFVLPLLTSRRYFLVPSSVNLERASPRYRQLLQDLKRTQLHEYQRRLVLGMLEVCPEVLPPALDTYGSLLKLKSEEIRTLLQNMLQLHKPEELLSKIDKTVSAKTLSTFVVQSSLPRAMLEHINTALEARKENIPDFMEFMSIMLSHCERYIQEIERRGLLDQFGRKQVKVDAIYKIVAMFPSIDRIMAAMARVRDDPAARFTECTLEHAMDILLVCIRSFRAYIEASSFITTFRDILKPAYRSEKVEKHFLNYEFKAIKVVIALEPQSLSFSSDLFPSVLALLTKVYLKGDPETQRDATEQLTVLFRNTALFGNRGVEIEFWFQALYDVAEPDQVSKIINLLAQEARRAAAAQSDARANSTKGIDHTLIDDALVKQQHELDALFARVEQESDDSTAMHAGSEALLDAQVELPVADNFFTHMFGPTTKRTENYQRYFGGVILRYLHYLPHPEIVHRAIKDLTDNSIPAAVHKYAEKWMSGSVHILPQKQGNLMAKYSEALAKKELLVLDEQFKSLEKGHVRSTLLNLLHQTLFYFCRCIAAHDLTTEKVHLISYHLKLLLTELLQPGMLSERDVGELMESIFLQRPIIFEHFTIVKHEDASLRRYVSEVVYELMQMLHTLPNFERYTELYSNKIVTEMIKISSVESKALLDAEMAEKLQTIFKLNERHCVTLLRHYARLPVEVFVEDGEKSYHYKQLCIALQRLVATNRGRQDNFLPEETVRGLVRVYMEIGQQNDGAGGREAIELEELEQALYGHFSMFPHSIAFVNPDIMRVFFDNSRRINKSLVKLATFLLARSSHLHAPFLELVGKNISKRELVYPLLNVAFREGILTEATVEEKNGKTLLAQIYAEFKGQILKMLEKPNKAAVIYRENPLTSQQLVRLCMPRNECVDFARKKLRIEAVESFQVRVLMEIYEGALKTLAEGGNPDTLQTIYCNGFTVLLQCFESLFRLISSAHYLLQQEVQIQRLNELVLAMYRWTTQTTRYHEALSKTSYVSITKTSQWTTFCKNCLKFGIETVRQADNERRFDDRLHVLPKLMAILVELFYIDGDKEQKEIERYYDWALSHSNFLRVLLMQHQYKPKTALVQLLYALACKNPSVVNAKHVPLLLGAYGATLTDANRYILALLQQYERSGVQMHEFRPFLWGETAIKHFSLEAQVEQADTVKNGEDGEGAATAQHSFRTNVKEVFSLLAEDKVLSLIENFPVWRKLNACSQLPEANFDDLVEQSDPEKRGLLVDYQPTSPVERFVEKTRRSQGTNPSFHSQKDLLEQHPINRELNAVTYDPAFLLPMMNLMYASEQADMLRRGIRSGILTLPFLCLSSRDEQMRLAAGSVLLRIRSHLELTKRLMDSKTWLHLLAIVQRKFVGMYTSSARYSGDANNREHVPRAPFLSMLFIAETVKLLPNVLDKLHGPMTRYILNQDEYNFRMVPNFLPLFNSSEVEHNVQRMFMVRTLQLGVKSHHDFAVLRASPIVTVMMAFHGSALSNRELNMAILQLLNSIARIPKSCQYLVDSLGFIGWLSERIDVIQSFEFDTIEAFLGLLSDCWYSMQMVAHTRAPHSRSTVFFQRGLLILTLKFVPLLSQRSSSTTLIRFLNMLEKTTSPRHGYPHLMSLVSEVVMEQLMQYFEELFPEQMWCVRYVRKCGTFAIDDEQTMGHTLQDAGADQTTILVLLGVRRFVVCWCNFQKDSGTAATHELDEVDVAMEAVSEEKHDDQEEDDNEEEEEETEVSE